MSDFELIESTPSMNEFEPIGLAPMQATTPQEPLWQIMRGPVGTGSCLAREEPAGGVLFIAPPGVALQRPERVTALMGWRRAHWQYGTPQDGVIPCTIEEVEELAPANHAWIHERRHEDERLDLMLARARGDADAGQAITEDSGVASVAPEPDRYRPLEAVLLADRRQAAGVTRSASDFSAAVAQVETLVAEAVSASHLATELDTLALTIGPSAVRELVVSQLYARRRSHSLRFNRFLKLVKRRGARERRLARLVAESNSALDLLEPVTGELSRQELDEMLVDLLYAQHRSLRRRATYPLLRTVGSPWPHAGAEG